MFDYSRAPVNPEKEVHSKVLPVHGFIKKLRVQRVTKPPKRRVVAVPRPEEFHEAAKSDSDQNDDPVFS